MSSIRHPLESFPPLPKREAATHTPASSHEEQALDDLLLATIEETLLPGEHSRRVQSALDAILGQHPLRPTLPDGEYGASADALPPASHVPPGAPERALRPAPSLTPRAIAPIAPIVKREPSVLATAQQPEPVVATMPGFRPLVVPPAYPEDETEPLPAPAPKARRTRAKSKAATRKAAPAKAKPKGTRSAAVKTAALSGPVEITVSLPRPTIKLSTPKGAEAKAEASPAPEAKAALKKQLKVKASEPAPIGHEPDELDLHLAEHREDLVRLDARLALFDEEIDELNLLVVAAETEVKQARSRHKRLMRLRSANNRFLDGLRDLWSQSA